MGEPPFTAKKLAERWGCSRQYVHKVIRSGELKHFKLGSKLVRVAAEEVARWERQNTSLESSTGAKSSLGGKATDDAAIDSVLALHRTN